MNFKNDLERQCYEIARQAVGDSVTVQHNTKVTIDCALFHEVASFKGPPAKEIDVLVVELLNNPKIVLLVSCKLLERKAEPAHVQEWCAVVNTFNRYADNTTYFGLVVSPSGFTSGCEAWATSYNLGILPPLKGRRLSFHGDAVLSMFGRVLKALQARVRLEVDDLKSPPAFYDFVFRLVSDFEGHQEAAADGRYVKYPQGWPSSFGEMYASVAGRQIQDLFSLREGAVAVLSGGMHVRFDGGGMAFGEDPQLAQGTPAEAACQKNIEMEPCTLDLIKKTTLGASIASAADLGSAVEFGLNGQFNLGLRPDGFYLMSTENPVEEHRL